MVIIVVTLTDAAHGRPHAVMKAGVTWGRSIAIGLVRTSAFEKNPMVIAASVIFNVAWEGSAAALPLPSNRLLIIAIAVRHAQYRIWAQCLRYAQV